MHTETPQNLTKSMFEKNTSFWHRLWADFDLKNVPNMTAEINQNVTLGLKGNPLEEPWVPKDASRPISTPVWHPK